LLPLASRICTRSRLASISATVRQAQALAEAQP
jgi:hypothetical protein